jgi:hypothetical protein
MVVPFLPGERAMELNDVLASDIGSNHLFDNPD